MAYYKAHSNLPPGRRHLQHLADNTLRALSPLTNLHIHISAKAHQEKMDIRHILLTFSTLLVFTNALPVAAPDVGPDSGVFLSLYNEYAD